MELRLIPFPSTDFGLPDGCESVAALPANSLVPNFFTAAFSLRGALDNLLRDLRPVDALVSDANHVWTTAVAAEHGIPCLIFQVTGLFRGQGRPRRLAGQSCPAAASDGCRPMAAGRPGEGRPCHQAAGCSVRKKAGEKMQRGRREKRRRRPAAAADGAGPVVAVVPTSVRAASGAGRLAGGGPAVPPGSRPCWLAAAREE